jgi:PhzF family phenazine biosynthesis protein
MIASQPIDGTMGRHPSQPILHVLRRRQVILNEAKGLRLLTREMLYHVSMSGSASAAIALIDAFSPTPFRGNPAAVCLLPSSAAQPPTASWMQALAVELNQPATAFLRSRADGDGFDLRWFSVRNELELCGHATLASTHYLWESGLMHPGETARFHTRAGSLTAKHDGEWIELNFPGKCAREIPAPAALGAVLGLMDVNYVGQNQMDLVVELASEDALRNLTPDLAALAAMDVRGAIVTAKGTGEFDFVSRCFFPRMGIPEDFVTGSAHCALAPYWAEKLGKKTLLAYQASTRGGVLRLEVDGDRVRIGGQAVTVSRGTLEVSL